MRTIIAAILLLGCSAMAAPGLARELVKGPLPLSLDAVTPLALAADDELIIEGVVTAAAPLVVVLRIDDMKSWGYASRFNGERRLPPGAFKWKIAANALKTAEGRTLDYRQVRRVFVFVGAGDGKVVLNRFEAVTAPRLPEGAKGYALGPEGAELPAGFERIAPGDPRVSGYKIASVHRPAPDPLVASGLRGIERLRLPWPAGRAQVSLWSEDPGEWELLPHPLERRIRINGTDIVSEALTPQAWIDRRYLHAADVEHSEHDDAWTAYGQRRGDLRTVEVDVGADGIVIDLAGSGPQALYLSAVLIEPAGTSAARAWTQAQRADWYRSNWPLVPAAPQRLPHASVELSDTVAARAPPPTVKAATAAGAGVRLIVSVTSQTIVDHPLASLTPLVGMGAASGSPALTGTVWAAQMRLDRPGAGDSVLARSDDLLSGDPGRLPLLPHRPRTYEMWVDVPASAAPGLYAGAFMAGSAASSLAIPVEIEVLDVKLPEVEKPAGFYVDEAPHLTWFETMAGARGTQAKCDLTLLARFGLTGSAPPLATPRYEKGAFEDDMARAREAGTKAPWLAYAPAKRLLAGHGIQKSAALIGRLEREWAAQGVIAPVWSLADEPSNPGHPQNELIDWIAAIRAQAPGARLAAQLNTPKDRPLISRFDTVLLNDGYGLDLLALADAASRGADVWLYNTGQPRLTAGLWMWMSPAKRYVQWHARMPTADPFDPIDGREGDVQALLPSRQVCPAVPSINRSVLEMADGVVDQRWLAWLAAQPGAKAAALREDIKRRITGRWTDAVRLHSHDLQRLRESIIKVASP